MSCGCTKNGLTSCGCNDNCPYKTSDITVFDGTFTSIVLDHGASLNDALAALEQYVVDTADALNLVYTVSPSNCLGVTAGEYGYAQLIDILISNICSVKDSISTIETNITSIESDITTIQGDITSIETDISNIETSIGDVMPIGSMIMYPIAAEPSSKWKICEGQALNKNTYADLFDVIGYNFGGSGTTFNLPNMKGKFLAGYDLSGAAEYQTIGSGGGSNSVTLTAAQSGVPPHLHTATASVNDPGHSHQFRRGQGSSGSGAADRSDASNVDSGFETTLSSDTNITVGVTVANSIAQNASDAHENRPEFIVFPWMIKVLN